jgi:hypothetical protein
MDKSQSSNSKNKDTNGDNENGDEGSQNLEPLNLSDDETEEVMNFILLFND